MIDCEIKVRRKKIEKVYVISMTIGEYLYGK